MEARVSAPSLEYEISVSDREMLIRPIGKLNLDSAPPFIRYLDPLLRRERPATLKIDLTALSQLDEFGVAVLAGLKRRAAEWQGSFSLLNISERNRELLEFYRFQELGKVHLSPRPLDNIFIRLGGAILKYLADQKEMLTFLGNTFFSLLYLLRHPRSLRWHDTIFYMQRTGVDAVPIVTVLSLLMGLIMAFMSAVQLRQFGANIYVASLVGISMTRELGPIITAIIVAGRSGSAFAAEIGAMKVSEEVDALAVMGFNPHAFLVLPKMIAAVLVVPFLTLFSDLAAILGGLLVGISMLDLTLHGYVSQTYESLTLFDFNWGLFKSVLFALLISWTGCLRGFQVSGGATAVGRAATSAVVTSIFVIILVDSILAVLLTYWAPERASLLM